MRHVYHVLDFELCPLSPDPSSLVNWSQNPVTETCSERAHSRITVLSGVIPYSLVSAKNSKESVALTSR